MRHEHEVTSLVPAIMKCMVVDVTEYRSCADTIGRVFCVDELAETIHDSLRGLGAGLRQSHTHTHGGWRDSLVVSVFDLGSGGPRFEPLGRGWSHGKRGPVALSTLGRGLLNPPSSNGW